VASFRLYPGGFCVLPVPSMKLTLVTETFPPEVNGVAMTLHRLVTGMAERGHAVEVVRPRQKADAAPHPAEPIDTYSELLVPGGPIPGYSGLRFGLPVRGRLLERWRTERPEIVHVATEGPLGLAATHAARTLGVPLSSSFHTNFHSYGKHYGYGFLIRTALAYLRWVHNRTGVTFAPSRDLIKTLAGEGFANLSLLGRGVDTRLFHPGRRDPELRAAWGAPDGETPVAVYVGRLAGEKNMPLTFEAYRALRQRMPELKLVAVGDGPSRAKLERENPDVIFAGMRRGEDLARHYASADCFLFASITETFGNVVTEALASGLVVLAYDYAAAGKYIEHGRNGFKAAYDDRDAFLSAAGEMAARRADWPAIREAAVETVRPLSWDAILNHFEAVLAQVVHGEQPAEAPALP